MTGFDRRQTRPLGGDSLVLTGSMYFDFSRDVTTMEDHISDFIDRYDVVSFSVYPSGIGNDYIVIMRKKS